MLRNDDLLAFHVSYALVFSVAACVSLYALSKRVDELRRKYRAAKSASVQPSSTEHRRTQARALIKESVAEAMAFWTGLEAGAAAELLQGELEDAVAIRAAENERTELEAEREKEALAEAESRITVYVLLGEDLTFTVLNLWMLGTNPEEISLVLLFSFAFNCTMLGAKLPEVLRLVQLAVRRVRSKRELTGKDAEVEELRKGKAQRRSSVSSLIGPSSKDAPLAAAPADGAAPGGKESLAVLGLEKTLRECYAVIEERDAVIVEKDAVLEERDAVIVERDATIAQMASELDMLKKHKA